MSLSNYFEFYEDLCGFTLFKRQVLEIRDYSAVQSGNGSAAQLQKDPQQQQQNPFQGYLFQNVAIGQCCCYYCPAFFKISYEVNGYNTKLTEVEVGRSVCCCCGECSLRCPCPCMTCCPEYDVVNSANKVFGKIKPHCLRDIMCCCPTDAFNTNLNTHYQITRDCELCPCSMINWTVKETATDSVASKFKFTHCCGLCPKISLDFSNVMNNEDKLLLLSTIPFLP